jgi:hypothetical protein
MYCLQSIISKNYYLPLLVWVIFPMNEQMAYNHLNVRLSRWVGEEINFMQLKTKHKLWKYCLIYAYVYFLLHITIPVELHDELVHVYCKYINTFHISLKIYKMKLSYILKVCYRKQNKKKIGLLFLLLEVLKTWLEYLLTSYYTTFFIREGKL